MPARKNRPGKCGTLPMSERWRLIEERVLSQARFEAERDRVFWPRGGDETIACQRLVDCGLMQRANQAYTVATRQKGQP